MQICCAFDDLEDSPKAILRVRGGAGASLGPTAGNTVMAEALLKVGSGCFIFLRARFCRGSRQRLEGELHCRRRRWGWGGGVAPAAGLRETQCGGRSGCRNPGGHTRAATPRNWRSTAKAAQLESQSCARVLQQQPLHTHQMHPVGGKAANFLGGALVAKQFAAAPAAREILTEKQFQEGSAPNLQ